MVTEPPPLQASILDPTPFPRPPPGLTAATEMDDTGIYLGCVPKPITNPHSTIFTTHVAVSSSPDFPSLLVSNFIISRQAPIVLLDILYFVFGLTLLDVLAIWWPSTPPCYSVPRPASKPSQP